MRRRVFTLQRGGGSRPAEVKSRNVCELAPVSLTLAEEPEARHSPCSPAPLPDSMGCHARA